MIRFWICSFHSSVFFLLNYQIKSSIVYSDGTLFYLRAFESIQSEFHYLFGALNKVHFTNDPLLHRIKAFDILRVAQTFQIHHMMMNVAKKENKTKKPNSIHASIDRIVQLLDSAFVWIDILLIYTKLELERAMR